MSARDASSSGAGTSGSSSSDWCTIESDPAVFTELLETVGVKGVELQELWSLDDASLAQLDGESTVYGLIFLFQWSDENRRNKKKGNGNNSNSNAGDDRRPDPPESSTSSPSPSPSPSINREPMAESDLPPGLFFAHQVTTNACATQAILSVVLNRVEDDPDKLGPVLHEFKAFTADFPPGLRGMAISGSEEIKTAHNSFARPDAFLNDEKIYKPKDDDDGEAYHFVAYLPFQDMVLELDGLQSGPIVIGSTTTTPGLEGGGDGGGSGGGGGEEEEEDHGGDWLAVAQRAIQARMDESSHVKYNLMAVVQDKRERLQALLDVDPENDEALSRLAAENAKREAWRLENQRRRHNYVPLVMEVLKGLARKGMLEQLSADAQVRAAARVRAGKERREKVMPDA